MADCKALHMSRSDYAKPSEDSDDETAVIPFRFKLLLAFRGIFVLGFAKQKRQSTIVAAACTFVKGTVKKGDVVCKDIPLGTDNCMEVLKSWVFGSSQKKRYSAPRCVRFNARVRVAVIQHGKLQVKELRNQWLNIDTGRTAKRPVRYTAPAIELLPPPGFDSFENEDTPAPPKRSVPNTMRMISTIPNQMIMTEHKLEFAGHGSEEALKTTDTFSAKQQEMQDDQPSAMIEDKDHWIEDPASSRDELLEFIFGGEEQNPNQPSPMSETTSSIEDFDEFLAQLRSPKPDECNDHPDLVESADFQNWYDCVDENLGFTIE